MSEKKMEKRTKRKYNEKEKKENKKIKENDTEEEETYSVTPLSKLINYLIFLK
jgi:hypothetical protein